MKHQMAGLFLWSCGAATAAFAQDTAPRPTAADDRAEVTEVLVTGSRIRRDPTDSALPIQVVTFQELAREGVQSSEQFVSFLSSNGSGLDNLASNADVVGGAQRGNNGASSANLRSQGANGTLILLNGRRVAAHGLNGGVVDVNQIPFSAIERIEVLKDGASAIYGTDAIGGVINFILKKDYEGFEIQGFADASEPGDGNIYKGSAIFGFGDLADRGFNLMAAVSYSTNKELRGEQRDFVDTFQPERGLSVDTRGTPHATIVPLAGTAIATAGAAPLVPGSTTVRASGGINVLDLPGQAGCGAIDGMAPYDDQLWAFPAAQFACAWDTGRAAVLQQPLDTLTYTARGVFQLGDHEIAAEVTGSEADASKRFSNLQLTPNTTTQNYAYRRIVGVNEAAFDAVANPLIAAFPTLAPQIAANPALSYRWRCIECGRRQIDTNTETNRIALTFDGPIAGGWDYAGGYSRATSESESVLGGGYYFRGTTGTGAADPTAPTAPGAMQPGIIGVLNSGRLNPFLFPGQTQSQEALDMLRAVSAEGVVLYGGKYTLDQVDASVSGRLFELPGGMAQLAVGVDYRKERYRFNGDAREAAARPTIIAAPFDDGNALLGVERDIKAVYLEALFPLFRGFELTGAVRRDDYDGFGSTTNPKFSLKYRPIDALMFRGSYNTGFRAPSFNQIFNGVTEALYTGRDIADPARCPGGIPNTTDPNCAAIAPLIVNGGRLDLGPETSDQYSFGVVIQPTDNFSATLDFWHIEREDTIQILSLRDLVNNFTLFPESFLRDSAGTLIAIDQRWLNAGGSITRGLDVALRGNFEAWGGQWSAGLDGTRLLKKQERVVQSAAFGESQIGVFTFAGDLGLRWKHNAFVNFRTGDWSFSLSQIFRNGYTNQALPGVANGTVVPPDVEEEVDDYITYNFSASYEGLIDGLRLTLGVKNVFDEDPPFAITYDSNFGSGSSWEPRVADPRGRAFTLLAEYKF
jgi:iron complex outermembrane receptor protein